MYKKYNFLNFIPVVFHSFKNTYMCDPCPLEIKRLNFHLQSVDIRVGQLQRVFFSLKRWGLIDLLWNRSQGEANTEEKVQVFMNTNRLFYSQVEKGSKQWQNFREGTACYLSQKLISKKLGEHGMKLLELACTAFLLAPGKPESQLCGFQSLLKARRKMGTEVHILVNKMTVYFSRNHGPSQQMLKSGFQQDSHFVHESTHYILFTCFL